MLRLPSLFAFGRGSGLGTHSLVLAQSVVGCRHDASHVLVLRNDGLDLTDILARKLLQLLHVRAFNINLQQILFEVDSHLESLVDNQVTHRLAVGLLVHAKHFLQR